MDGVFASGRGVRECTGSLREEVVQSWGCRAVGDCLGMECAGGRARPVEAAGFGVAVEGEWIGIVFRNIDLTWAVFG